MRFFFYGTLMDGAVRIAVLGAAARTVTIEPATLGGWRRSPVRGKPYPVVVPAAGCLVDGMLADGVDGAAASRLDRFEGLEYRRRRVTARRAADAAFISCWVYAASDAAFAAIGRWDLDTWRQRHRAAMLRRLAVNFR